MVPRIRPEESRYKNRLLMHAKVQHFGLGIRVETTAPGLQLLESTLSTPYFQRRNYHHLSAGCTKWRKILGFQAE